MSIHKFVGEVVFDNLEQVAAFVTSLGLLEDAPTAEIRFIPDTNDWRCSLYKD